MDTERSRKMKERWADTDSDYRAKMAAAFKERIADPTFQRERLKGLRKRMAEDDKYRQQRDARLRKMNADPRIQRVRIEAVKKANSDPEARARKSRAIRETWSNPGARKRRIASMRKAARTPSVRAKKSAASKRKWRDPDYARRVSEASKKASNTPEARARKSRAIRETWSNPGTRKRRIASIKKAHARTEVRARKAEISRKTWEDPNVRLRRTEPARQRKIARLAKELDEARAADQVGIPRAKRRRGPQKSSIEETNWFKVGTEVERHIAEGRSLEEARRKAQGRYDYATVRRYHKLYRSARNRGVLPVTPSPGDEVSFVSTSSQPLERLACEYCAHSANRGQNRANAGSAGNRRRNLTIRDAPFHGAGNRCVVESLRRCSTRNF